MCGISGYIAYGDSISGMEFYKAHRRMAKRGPDDEGFAVISDGRIREAYGDGSIESVKYKDEDIRKFDNIQVVMGHVRLSIIDLSMRGHQPIVDKRNGIIMSYNGEIYNYRELREELENKGYKFGSNSDTEVLFYAYQEWGKNCFNRLNGMWAVGIYESRTRQLTLSRDRFGVKPLYYRNNCEGIAFASETKVICSLQKSNKINMSSVDKYLNHCVFCDGEETFVDGILEVLPGHCLTFCNGELVEDYHYWQYRPGLIKMSDKEAEEKFNYLLRDSIKLRMRSDVEVGSLLSGGLDSNVIVSTLHDEKLIMPTYKTFSSVYENERYSEKKYIEKASVKLGIQPDYVYMTADKVMDCLDVALENSEMPTRAVPMMLQYLLYEHIRSVSNIKVVLNGQGADELFGGYNADYMTRFLQLLYEGRVSKFVSEVREYRKNRNAGMMQIAFGIWGQYKHISSNMENVFNHIAFEQITHTPLREYLMYDDRAAMAFGIENRAPFLDYRLVEFAFSLTPDLKVNQFNNKAIVRQYAKGMVAEDILNRKDKMGFTSPQESWQREEWKEIFDDTFSRIRRNGLVGMDGRVYYNLYERYSQQRSNDWARIWRIFCLDRWQKVITKWGVA